MAEQLNFQEGNLLIKNDPEGSCPDIEVDIHRKLMDFITRNFLIEEEEIILDESLVDQGIIDSFGLIEIASFIENEFSISVEEDQMKRDNFGSVIKIVNFIEREL